MFYITKEINFCYGHRLMNHKGKCKNLHGHSVKASITLKSEKLDQNGMVCDFSDLKDIVTHYIDEYLDHNFLLHKNDPLIPLLQQQNERFIAIEEHPTAEIISKMIFLYIKNQGLPVIKVDLWETSTACASYQEEM